jgi:hypothetical protein
LRNQIETDASKVSSNPALILERHVGVPEHVSKQCLLDPPFSLNSRLALCDAIRSSKRDGQPGDGDGGEKFSALHGRIIVIPPLRVLERGVLVVTMPTSSG